MMNYFKILSVALLLALFCSATSFAERLTVDAPASVVSGTTGVLVNINIDNGLNTAGASFTVTYDAAKLQYKSVSSTFFAAFSNQNINPSSVSVGTPPITYTKGLVDNPSSGKVMLAAAQTANGTAGAKTLFTLTFDVINGVTGNALINITATTINNTAAGYPAGGAAIPMLVGIGANNTYPEITPSVTSDTISITPAVVDADGDGITDSWEITHFGNLTTANAASDFDKDGYTDKQEFLNGGSYNPKVANPAGGPGYNGVTDKGWVMLNDGSAENMIAFRDGIAADFGAQGLFYFNGSSWAQLSALNPQMMVQVDADNDGVMELVAYFPGNGVSIWDGSWSFITANVPENMVAFGNKPAFDFGATGLYLYEGGSLTLLRSANPSLLAVADVDSDGALELAAVFPSLGNGLFIYDTAWTGPLGTAPIEGMLAYGKTLAIDYGTAGLYHYSTADGFTQLDAENPSHLAVTDLDGDGTLDLAASFPGTGIFIFSDGTWNGPISNLEPESLTAFNNGFAIDLGTAGMHSYTSAFGLVLLANLNPAMTVTNSWKIFCKFTAGIFMYVAEDTAVTLTSDLASPQSPGTPITFTAAGHGGSGNYEYRFWTNAGSGYSMVRDYSTTNTYVWTPSQTGKYDILVDVRNTGSTVTRESLDKIFFYQIATYTPASGVTASPSVASPQSPGTPITFTAAGHGGSGTYEYRFWINSGAGYNMVRDYSTTSAYVWTPSQTGNYDILIDVRNVGSTAIREASKNIFFYQIATVTPASGVTVTPSVASPQAPGTSITITAAGQGGSGPYEYRFWINSGSGYTIVRDYSTTSTYVWTASQTGNYDILVDVRNVGSTAIREASNNIFFYQITTVTPASGVTVTPSVASPQAPGTSITLTAAGQGGSGPYEYRFWINSGSGYTMVRDYSTTSTYVWTPSQAGNCDILVDVKNVGSTAIREAFTKIFYYQIMTAPEVTLVPNLSSPQAPGKPITFTATGQGGSGTYEYRFWINSGSGYTIVQNYSTTNTLTWTPTIIGGYDILVDLRSVGSAAFREASAKFFMYQIQ